MKYEKVIAQLESLIEDAKSHEDKDGELDRIYQDDVEALTEAIDAVKAECGRSESFWHSAEERLPEKDGVYLLYAAYCGYHTFGYYKACWNGFDGGHTEGLYWAALPEDPAGVKRG